MSRNSWLETSSPHAEREHAWLRVLIGSLVLLGLLTWRFLGQELIMLLQPLLDLLQQYELERKLVYQPISQVTYMVWFLVGFVGFSLALWLRVLSSPPPSVVRRLLGILADNAGTTYFMLHMGEGGALVVGIYMFVAFGNGYRYGRLYLHISQSLALVGFLLVLTVSDFWNQHLLIGVGIFLAMVVLPFYIGVLAERSKEAKNQADQEKARLASAYDELLAAVLDGQRSMAECIESFNIGNDATARDKVRVANQKLLELISKHAAPEVRKQA